MNNQVYDQSQEIFTSDCLAFLELLADTSSSSSHQTQAQNDAFEPIRVIFPESNGQAFSTQSNNKPSPKVDHTYTDYSSVVPNIPLNANINRKQFPMKLMTMLSDPLANSIITWCSHGRSFKVTHLAQFECHILPRYFKTNHMRSFRKQLSLWGFKRITKGADAGSYYHESFLRSMPHLLSHLKYQKIKGIGKASRPNPDAEPNFYRLPALPHTSQSIIQQIKKEAISSVTASPHLEALVVSDDEDSTTFEEYVAINRLMRFPGPFEAPSCIEDY